MTLYEYLKLHKDDEVTVSDVDYDTESYWYWNEPKERDAFDKAVAEIAKKLEVKKINDWNVICNISEVIEKHIEELENLFDGADLNDIMFSFDNIVAGYISEKGMIEFSKIICQ